MEHPGHAKKPARQDEESRKIQFSGKSSYMIALPKRWVEEMGLRPGHHVIVSQQSNGSLLITQSGGVPAGRSEIALEVSQKDAPGTMTRKLISVYLLGYSIINVRANEGRLGSTQREIVEEVVRRNLVGTEIIADSTEGIMIQVLLSSPELTVENALRRMFLITMSMHKDTILALRNLDPDLARGVTRADDEVDRFNLYVTRQLMMAVQSGRMLKDIGIESPRDCLGYRVIVRSIERSADQARKIAQELPLMKRPLDELSFSKVAELSNYALKIFEESSTALFKGDYYAADAVVEKGRLIANMERDVLVAMETTGAIKTFPNLRLIVRFVARPAEYASDIAEAVLDMTADRHSKAHA